jgi:hypothetical protein
MNRSSFRHGSGLRCRRLQRFPESGPCPVGAGKALVGEGLVRRHPQSGQAFFWAVRSWSLVDTRVYPISSPVLGLNVPVIPHHRAFSRGSYGNLAPPETRRILIRKLWVSVAPVGDRRAGHSERIACDAFRGPYSGRHAKMCVRSRIV